MKKVVILILLLFTLWLPVAADGNGGSNPKSIGIQLRPISNGNPKGHREPSPIVIDINYVPATQSIDIIYPGDAPGEVFVYFKETLVGYSSEINSTIPLPYTFGVYDIEIVTDYWSAQGSIEL